MLNDIQKRILQEVADMAAIPETGAVNIRSDGKKTFRQNTKNITIESKTDKDGIDIRIAPGTKNEAVHIPVVVTESGRHDMVYNDFYIGEGAEVRIVAGCGIHNCGDCDTSHDGIHTFYVGKNAKMTYVEKHYGEGEGSGKRILNPQTILYLEEGATVTLETVQIFYPRVEGNCPCFGHVSCDAIIMGKARVRAIPEITCNHVDAGLIHEAAIGKIAGEQILKLMTLGLTAEEAEEKILEGFLR